MIFAMNRADSCHRGWELSGGASSEERHMDVTVTAADAKRTCAECGTYKTPLWRSGPAGPKSLCNACGIRSRKKRRAILGMEDNKPGKIRPGSSKNNSVSTLKRGILAIGKHVAMPRSKKKVRDGEEEEEEEEQAAMLLMALSYGSVYVAGMEEKNPVGRRRAK